MHSTTVSTRHPLAARALLWTVQVLVAALFAFAGIVKLKMPVQLLVQQSGMPAGFLHFIAVAEILGALGLVLPGLFRIHRHLTPLAARGLAIIMLGAVSVSVLRLGVVSAILPLVTGILLVAIIRGRASWAEDRRHRPPAALQADRASIA